LLFRAIALVCVGCCFISGSVAPAQEVHIEVFGLFHPHELTVTPAAGKALTVQAGEHSFVIEGSSSIKSLAIRGSGDQLQIELAGRVISATAVHFGARTPLLAGFNLEVPREIRRFYSGVLDISSETGVLRPVVTMEIETAVASVVQAESTPGTPIEALKAQAVAARSYFMASRGRHHHSNFCDTTHCQFLREPPAEDSPAVAAAVSTRGLILAYEDHTFAAMYTHSCGGRTRTPAEIGLSTNGYPYFPVVCEYCARNPFRWSRQLSRQDAARLTASNESARLRVDRRLGWNAVPSTNFTVRPAGEHVLLVGTGQGHGVGMCQTGARAMAEHGASFHEILQEYYPNAKIMPANLALR
jgi:peptidoglycan hydrolase-like amidase